MNEESWKCLISGNYLSHRSPKVQGSESIDKLKYKTIVSILSFISEIYIQFQATGFLKINPDTALERTNQKFSKRFQYLEQHAQKIGKTLHKMSLDAMEVIWQEAKKAD